MLLFLIVKQTGILKCSDNKDTRESHTDGCKSADYCCNDPHVMLEAAMLYSETRVSEKDFGREFPTVFQLQTKILDRKNEAEVWRRPDRLLIMWNFAEMLLNETIR